MLVVNNFWLGMVEVWVKAEAKKDWKQFDNMNIKIVTVVVEMRKLVGNVRVGEETR
jgi:hypothetical protein